MTVTLPKSGFVFWPVGNGDSTTICLDDGLLMQVDLNHLECADDEDDPRIHLLDALIPLLPKRNNKPYLPLFVLSHPDLDHCRGFKELLKKVTIGELWFSPRIFSEFKCDLCEDACAFKEEAMRRVKQAIAGKQEAGDRVRIIGVAEILDEDGFKGFPKDRLSVPGTVVTEIDGSDRSALFRVFFHAPFKDDSDGERNDTSVGMQVTLISGDQTGQALLLGDLCYPTMKRIFDVSDAGTLAWNVLLAPHHCSKSVMYWQGDEDDDVVLQQGLLDAIEAAAGSPGYVILSSDSCPVTNADGDNPPHAKAKARYEEIAPDGVLCTGTHGDAAAPDPIIFELTEAGLAYLGIPDDAAATESQKALAAAVPTARGANEPPTERVGFGSH
jgi:beta-lactamase superfamily II metal-dependent hydrolase